MSDMRMLYGVAINPWPIPNPGGGGNDMRMLYGVDINPWPIPNPGGGGSDIRMLYGVDINPWPTPYPTPYPTPQPCPGQNNIIKMLWNFMMVFAQMLGFCGNRR